MTEPGAEAQPLSVEEARRDLTNMLHAHALEMGDWDQREIYTDAIDAFEASIVSRERERTKALIESSAAPVWGHAHEYVESRWGTRPHDERRSLADAYRAGSNATKRAAIAALNPAVAESEGEKA